MKILVNPTDDELNEAYAQDVDNAVVVGHQIAEESVIQGERYLIPRQVPEYIKHLGRQQVVDRLLQKGVKIA